MYQELTMRPIMQRWLTHNRQCQNWTSVGDEVCRLNFNQAMRLCFECSFDGAIFQSEQTRALAAYQQGRPWDYLMSSGYYPRVRPLKR